MELTKLGIHGIMAWELWENGINHIDLMTEMELQIWTKRFSRKDTMHWNGTKQIGGITGENCYKCQDWQSWKIFDSCVNFSWFFWEVWLGELATLGMIAINDIKDGIKIKRNWWNCRNWWNENNQINGIGGINKTVGIGSTNEIGIESAVLIWMVELRAWKLGNRWFQSKIIEVMEPMELNV